MRPSPWPSRPLAGCRRTRSSIAAVPSFSIHLLLCSAGFRRPPRSYEKSRLLHGLRPVVVASFGSTAQREPFADPCRPPRVRCAECPAAAVPITVPTSVGHRASRSKARSPGRTGLLRALLAFGAAVRLGLLPHTASRPQEWRLTTTRSACSCLRLAVAANRPREGLSPPIQRPCRAHLRPPPPAACGVDRGLSSHLLAAEKSTAKFVPVFGAAAEYARIQTAIDTDSCPRVASRFACGYRVADPARRRDAARPPGVAHGIFRIAPSANTLARWGE